MGHDLDRRMSDDADWNDLLDPDERIIWQGAPSSKVRLEDTKRLGRILVVVVIGAVLGANLMGPEMREFGWILISMAVGFYIFLAEPIRAAFERHRTSYALTNARALIWSAKRVRPALISVPITPETSLKLDEGPARAVWFGIEKSQGVLDGEIRQPQGFELIENPREVYQLLRKVQRGDA